MPISQITSAGIENGTVVPADLTTGAPSWTSTGNVTITGTANIAGALTLPGQPIFSATGSSTQSWSGAAAYQTVQLNAQTTMNSHPAVYNTGTYTFTAPVAGVYMFWAKVTQTTTATGPAASLFVNGSAASGVQELIINYSVGYLSSSGFCALPLSAGDLVTLRVINFNNTTVTLDTTRCAFMGYLIG